MGPDTSKVVMAHALPMLARRTIEIAWFAEMGEALRGGNKERVLRLFEPALSVPISMRLCPDQDACQLVSLLFSENLFASTAASGADSFWKFAEKAIKDNVSLPKLSVALRQYGMTFKGMALTDANVKAFKSLAAFVEDGACGVACSLVEAYCPEIWDPTLLMRVAQLSAARAGVGEVDREERARASLIFIFDCLRVLRLTGSCSNEEGYTVGKVTGQEKKTPAMVHTLFNRTFPSTCSTRWSCWASLWRPWCPCFAHHCQS